MWRWSWWFVYRTSPTFRLCWRRLCLVVQSSLHSHSPPVIPVIVKTMCVLGTPGFVPPIANFDGDSTDVPLPVSAAPVNKSKKGAVAEECNVFDTTRLVQVSWLVGFFFRSEEEKGPWSEFIRKQLSAGRNNRWRQNPAGKCRVLIFARLSVTSHLTGGFCCCYRSHQRRTTGTPWALHPTERFSESWMWRSSGCWSMVCCPVRCSTQSSKPT